MRWRCSCYVVVSVQSSPGQSKRFQSYRSRNARKYIRVRKGMTRRSILAMSLRSVVFGGHST